MRMRLVFHPPLRWLLSEPVLNAFSQGAGRSQRRLAQGPRFCAALCVSTVFARLLAHLTTDGTGTPDPNPRNVNRCFQHD